VLLAAASAEGRCRRDVPSSGQKELARRQFQDECSHLTDCFACNAATVNLAGGNGTSKCGWCSGTCTGSQGCYKIASPGYTQCSHPEDGWIANYDLCTDPCNQQQYCDLCVGFVDKTSKCGWCAGQSGCYRSLADGTRPERSVGCYDFRAPVAQQTDVPGACARYTTADQKTCADYATCNECADLWFNATTKCVWCHSADQTGDPAAGSCRASPSGQATCASGQTAYDQSNLGLCPQTADGLQAASISVLVVSFAAVLATAL
jgi:hypothetical protein